MSGLSDFIYLHSSTTFDPVSIVFSFHIQLLLIYLYYPLTWNKAQVWLIDRGDQLLPGSLVMAII